MASARKAGVPPEVLQEWEADFRQKKAKQQKTGGKKLPSGSVQYTHNGVTYTAKYAGKNRSVHFPEAAYEARVEGSRSRKGEQQKIKLGEAEQLMQQYRYEDAKMLSEYMGQPIDVDHNIPIAKGGFSNDPNNLGLTTRETNLAKSNKLGGSDYNRALDENRYLSKLANQLRSVRGAIRFVSRKADPIQTGVDIIQQGQTGSLIDQVSQVTHAKVQDPFEASAKARARGGKTTVGTVTLPDLGISEFFIPPKQ